jgi:hypothetical protein
MLGHCAGLGNAQRLGDYVLAHGYVREDHVLDQERAGTGGQRGHLAGFELKRVMPTGTVASVDNRNYESRTVNRSIGRPYYQGYQGRTVRESGTWARMPDPHAGIKSARGRPTAAAQANGHFCCWCGLPAMLLLRRWLGSLSACF